MAEIGIFKEVMEPVKVPEQLSLIVKRPRPSQRRTLIANRLIGRCRDKAPRRLRWHQNHTIRVYYVFEVTLEGKVRITDHSKLLHPLAKINMIKTSRHPIANEDGIKPPHPGIQNK